ncbi:hypothetical protein D8B26_006780 [Coccidioides posadasii str. Silveira]|uniref:uncharacterized protein n=1 Tax=Coccidioides posadasii (strain RMSCC 757 / Silveira) TaxID=443226 RepID=UPI001BED4428|nr:hypothetical protein D8B26_006780 [Coccidioides posadasii str. Silveira]
MTSLNIKHVRHFIISRFGKIQRVAHIVDCIFKETRALKHSELTENGLWNLRISLYCIDPEKPSVSDRMSFYAPLPKECPKIYWDEKKDLFWKQRTGLK